MWNISEVAGIVCPEKEAHNRKEEKMSLPSDIRILSAESNIKQAVARTPLKFGAVVVEECPFCEVKVTVEKKKGDVAEGYGGIFLMDLWAFPDPSVPYEKKNEAMQEVMKRFCKRVTEYNKFSHPVDIFWNLREELKKIGEEVSKDKKLDKNLPFLASLVSASPIDAAIHDAFGKVNKIDTYKGYGREFMEHDLSYYLGKKFKGKYIADYIRKDYLPRIPVFHLVGGGDKLRQTEVDETDPQDGLPNSLDEWIRKDGLFCLKIKLKGNDLRWDINRIEEVTSIAHEIQKEKDLFFSIDTNEQCESPEYMVELLTKLKENHTELFKELLYIEQPTERDLNLHRFDMNKISELKPVIVDESLTGIEEFGLALELGWSGIALKTCKCQSEDLLFAAKASEEGIPYSVQDLTNPGISLIHSVGLAARTYPIKGVEANSCQFFPEASKKETRVHSNIFYRKDGMVSTESIRGYGLGYQMEKIREIEG